MTLLLFPLFTAAAQAQADTSTPATSAPCEPGLASHLFPMDGAVDVPLDAHLLALFDGDNCGGVGIMTLETEGALVLELNEPPAESFRNRFLVDEVPDAPLLPDTEYRLTMTSWTDQDLISMFTTGTSNQSVEPLDAPVVSPELVQAEWVQLELVVTLDVHVSGAAPDTLVRVAESLSGWQALEIADEAGEASGQLLFSVAGNTTELCAVASVQDPLGGASEWVEGCTPFDAPPAPESDSDASERGCSTVSASGSAALWGVLLLPVLLRVRSGDPTGSSS